MATLNSIWIWVQEQWQKGIVQGSEDFYALMLENTQNQVYLGLGLAAVPYLILGGYALIYTLLQLFFCYMAVMVDLEQGQEGFDTTFFTQKT